jgi:hypothetical protein
MKLIKIVQELGEKMNTTKESPRGTNRKTAIIVGILYIIGTVAGILSVVVTQPILGTPDYLTKISTNENPIIIGSLFVLTMGFALAMVPVMLFPILKKQNESLALGYVVFRGALETVIYIASVITWLFLVLASHEYGVAGANASYFRSLGSVLLKGSDSITTILIFVFSLDALMLYYLFYRSKLIPRWISVWGFIAILLHFTTGFLIIFHLTGSMSTITTVMNLPIFLQEMVMAIWLIVKGFNPAAITFLYAKTDANKRGKNDR